MLDDQASPARFAHLLTNYIQLKHLNSRFASVRTIRYTSEMGVIISNFLEVPMHHANIDDSSNPLHNHKDVRRVRMSTAHRPRTLIAKSFLHRWRQCFETKAKWNLHNSTIGTIFGTVLDRLINDSKMKELVKNSSYRRSYSIMNVGMADFASCRYYVRRMHHSSSRHTSVA